MAHHHESKWQHFGPGAEWPLKSQDPNVGLSTRIGSNDKTPISRGKARGETLSGRNAAWAPRKRRFVQEDEMTPAESPLSKKSTSQMIMSRPKRTTWEKQTDRAPPSALVTSSSSPRTLDTDMTFDDVGNTHQVADSRWTDLPTSHTLPQTATFASYQVEHSTYIQWEDEDHFQNDFMMGWGHGDVAGTDHSDLLPQIQQSCDNGYQTRFGGVSEMAYQMPSSMPAHQNAADWQHYLQGHQAPAIDMESSWLPPPSAQPRSDDEYQGASIEVPFTSDTLELDDPYSVDSITEEDMLRMLDQATGVANANRDPMAEENFSPGPEFEAAMSSLPDEPVTSLNTGASEDGFFPDTELEVAMSSLPDNPVASNGAGVSRADWADLEWHGPEISRMSWEMTGYPM